MEARPGRFKIQRSPYAPGTPEHEIYMKGRGHGLEAARFVGSRRLAQAQQLKAEHKAAVSAAQNAIGEARRLGEQRDFAHRRLEVLASKGELDAKTLAEARADLAKSQRETRNLEETWRYKNQFFRERIGEMRQRIKELEHAGSGEAAKELITLRGQVEELSRNAAAAERTVQELRPKAEQFEDAVAAQEFAYKRLIKSRGAHAQEMGAAQGKLAEVSARHAEALERGAKAERELATASNEISRLRSELENRRGDLSNSERSELSRRSSAAEARADAAVEDRDKAWSAREEAEARLGGRSGEPTGPGPQPRGTPGEPVEPGQQPGAGPRRRPGRRGARLRREVRTLREGLSEAREQIAYLQGRADNVPGGGDPEAIRRFEEVSQRLGRIEQRLDNGVITEQQAGEEMGDVIQQVAPGAQMQGATAEDLLEAVERLAQQRQPAREEGGGSDRMTLEEMKKAGMSDRDVRKVALGREGIPTGAAGFAETGRNMGRGLMAILNPSMFASALIIVVIVLLIYIVLQLFKYVKI